MNDSVFPKLVDFSFIWNTVLPRIGEFFTKLYAFSSLTTGQLIDVISGKAHSMYAWNIFNGSPVYCYYSLGDGVFSNLLLAPIRWIIKGSFLIVDIPMSTPCWAGMLIWLSTVGILIAIIGFFVKFVTNIFT